MPGLPAEPPDLLDHTGRVGDGLGIGHRVDGRVPAERGGSSAARDRLGVFPARLSQVSMQVDQAGQRDQAAGVEHGDAGASRELTGAAPRRCYTGGRPAERPGASDQPAAPRPRCRRPAAAARGAHRASTLTCDPAEAPVSPPAVTSSLSPATADTSGSREPLSSRYSTAIRTETPLVTCSTIVDLGESATSAAISTPRFIGPGCITMAWSGNSAIRSQSRPYLRRYSRTVGKYASDIRSCCTRSIITTSLPGSTEDRS